MPVGAYFMVRGRIAHRGLGPDHFDRHDRTKSADRLIRRLKALALKVHVRAAA